MLFQILYSLTSNQRQIDVLLTNRHMLTAPALKRDDYGDDLGGTSTRPMILYVLYDQS